MNLASRDQKYPMQELTPMLRQYLQLKEEYPDCILFFRMGDFYEMFFEDAEEASPALEIALTTRDKGKENPVPMCGIPHHAIDNYVAKLLKKGYRVAICEQVEDPSEARGIVKREVIRVVSPGLITDIGEIEAKEDNYISGIVHDDGRWGASFLDFSTGKFITTELSDLSEVLEEIHKLNPREVVMPEDLEGHASTELLDIALSDTLVNYTNTSSFDIDTAVKIISETFNIMGVDGLGLKDSSLALTAAGGLLRYVTDCQKGDISHLSYPGLYAPSEFMIVDEVTERNLELSKTIYEGTKSGSLLSLIDSTTTPMGGRLLRQWLNYPLTDINSINDRLDAVEKFAQDINETQELRENLSHIADLERLAGKVSLRSAGARDIVNLSQSLKRLPDIIEKLELFELDKLNTIIDTPDDFSELTEKIDITIVESPPLNLKDGGLINDGIDSDLDELREISRSGKDWIIGLETEERQKTGIKKLKVRFNRVFGYFIEVTNSQLDLVPENYIRKQTLVGAERYITPELKDYEAKVLGAEERIKRLEYDIFTELRELVREWIPEIKRAGAIIATIDTLTNLSVVAVDLGFSRPVVNDSRSILIEGGRHPMVERSLPQGSFVPNDVYIDCDTDQLLIITGPNMAGKSTIIRQVAIITLMAQMGSFVPARKSEIGVVDRVFTRVGASDSLVRGQSTFMVEMIETANILNNATGKSLVILDEIGRGTSTFDGISIAWSVAEYIHDDAKLRPRTLFATHYHELAELATIKERVKNYNISVKEWNEQIIFLRKMTKGVASHSYGIEVARLAGLPPDVLRRAREILDNLEKGEFTSQGVPTIASGDDVKIAGKDEQLDLFSNGIDGKLVTQILDELAGTDVHEMTPIDAMNKLDELVKKIKKIKNP